MDRTDLQKHIEIKQAELDRIASELKKQFFGLDAIIDNIMTHVRTWYIFPKLITRPQIVCLWGLTGVGKTDLIRKLARLLDMGSQYCEISLRDCGRLTHHSIEDKLYDGGVITTQPSILMLDEFQEFRTIDESGMSVRNIGFIDIWELMSDGQFVWTTEKRDDVLELMMRCDQSDDDMEAPADEDEDDISFLNIAKAKVKAILSKYKIKGTTKKNAPVADAVTPSSGRRNKEFSWWELRKFKKMFGLSESVAELSKLTRGDVYRMAKEKVNSKELDYGIKYSSMLIFVCGNLDEAFRCADEVEEHETDADMYHAYTSSINFLTIKKSLTVRFKPEQIARLGNNHVIYPSLNKKAFESIIRNELDKTAAAFSKEVGVTVTYDRSVPEFIYRNGVFPVSGTRPVFSTINSVFTSILPQMAANTLMRGLNTISIYFAKQDNQWYAYDSNTLYSIELKGQVDTLQQPPWEEKMKSVCVHEAGHAIMAIKLLKRLPDHIIVKADGSEAKTVLGLSRSNNIFTTEHNILDTMMGFSGLIAERIVLGDDYTCPGSAADINKITATIKDMVINQGLDQFKYSVYSHSSVIKGETNEKVYDFDAAVNKRVAERITEIYKSAEAEFRNLMGTAYWELFKRIAMGLYTKRILYNYDIAAMADELGIEYCTERYATVPTITEKWEDLIKG